MTFGERISRARHEQGLTLRAVASKCRSRAGVPLSATYINDIEKDRRAVPPSYLIEQFASVLQIPREVLYFEANRLPPDYCGLTEDHDRITRAYGALRAALAPARTEGQEPSQP